MAGALSLLEGLHGGGGGGGGGGGEAHAGLLRSLRDAVQLSLLWSPAAPHSAPAAEAAAAAAAAQAAARLPPLRFVPGFEAAPPAAGTTGGLWAQLAAQGPSERADSKRRRPSGDGAPATG